MITTTAIGRLVRDPELRYTHTDNTPLCRFRLACDRARGREGTSFLDIVVWGPAAEANAKWLSKGRQVAVSGSLDHQQWQTPNGNFRERYELNADHITWLAVPRSETDNEPDPTGDDAGPDQAPAAGTTAKNGSNGTTQRARTTTKNGSNGRAKATAAK